MQMLRHIRYGEAFELRWIPPPPLRTRGRQAAAALHEYDRTSKPLRDRGEARRHHQRRMRWTPSKAALRAMGRAALGFIDPDAPLPPRLRAPPVPQRVLKAIAREAKAAAKAKGKKPA